MPPLASNSLVILSLTLPDKKNLQPKKSMSGFCGSLAGGCRSPASADAVDVTATEGEDTFVAIVVVDISIVVDVDSELVETPTRPDISGADNTVPAEMLVDATMEVGVMVSFEVGGAESHESAVMVAGG